MGPFLKLKHRLFAVLGKSVVLLSVVKVQEFGGKRLFYLLKNCMVLVGKDRRMHCRLELRDHPCPAPTSRAVMQTLGGSRYSLHADIWTSLCNVHTRCSGPKGLCPFLGTGV